MKVFCPHSQEGLCVTLYTGLPGNFLYGLDYGVFRIPAKEEKVKLAQASG